MEGYKADLLKITGTLLREQKFYHIRVFTKSNLDNVCVLQDCREDARPFNPQILTATSGAANAGIDVLDVFGVTRLEFPPSLLDVQQEKGRAGRRPNATSDRDWYLLCLSLETFVVLLKRLYNNPASNQDTSSYFATLQNDMQDAISMLVLPQFCLNAALELKMGNPYLVSQERPPPCLDSCAYCTGRYKTLFPTIIKAGVTTVLLQLFNGSNLMKMPAVLDKDLVDAIKKYPGSNRMIFGVNTDKRPEPVLVKKLVLMLIAANLVRHYPKRKETSPGKFEVTIYASLGFVEGDDTTLALSDATYWSLLPLKD
jgi:hypothetical protein